MSEQPQDEALDITEAILSLVKAPSKRDDVVPLYSTAILYGHFARPAQMTARWPEVNAAIISRWSMSGLTYIKTRAWKRAEERAANEVAAQKARDAK